jgi:hypothetical protein
MQSSCEPRYGIEPETFSLPCMPVSSMRSYRVGLLQVGRMPASKHVALSRLSSRVVVAWFVTGSGMFSEPGRPLGVRSQRDWARFSVHLQVTLRRLNWDGRNRRRSDGCCSRLLPAPSRSPESSHDATPQSASRGASPAVDNCDSKSWPLPTEQALLMPATNVT